MEKIKRVTDPNEAYCSTPSLCLLVHVSNELALKKWGQASGASHKNKEIHTRASSKHSLLASFDMPVIVRISSTLKQRGLKQVSKALLNWVETEKSHINSSSSGFESISDHDYLIFVSSLHLPHLKAKVGTPPLTEGTHAAHVCCCF